MVLPELKHLVLQRQQNYRTINSIWLSNFPEGSQRKGGGQNAEGKRGGNEW